MIYQIIGRNIRSQRMMHLMTQEKLAEQADISLSFLGHIERGTRKLSVETLYKIAMVLDCSVDELMNLHPKDQKTQRSAKEILRLAMHLAEENA